LLSFLAVQGSTCLSVPVTGGARCLVAFVVIAANTCWKKIVEMVCAAFRPGNGMFHFPRSAFVRASVVFERQLGVAQMAVAARSSVNLSQQCFVVSHTLTVTRFHAGPPARVGLFNPESYLHAVGDKIRTTFADNLCLNRDFAPPLV
jgi:hypothetical protein